ncbi:hypothetical protein GSI_13427 [Ganoderma sinense ZZ0214-1]|uniref:Uncharacterized protein n=1 Tax=Ganoderma sinense ZZ0214-1 TaxID=1077348 RepID=A0A2G8RQQ9_9APHY|nr:hypothetical protein GSI_13427 [Ganoderma sinense ZZ0214-1]
MAARASSFSASASAITLSSRAFTRDTPSLLSPSSSAYRSCSRRSLSSSFSTSSLSDANRIGPITISFIRSLEKLSYSSFVFCNSVNASDIRFDRAPDRAW